MPLTVSSDGTAHSCSAWRIGCAPGVSAEELLRTVRLRDAMCKVVEHLEGDGRDRYIANCLVLRGDPAKEGYRESVGGLSHTGPEGRHFYLEAKVFEEPEGEARPTML